MIRPEFLQDIEAATTKSKAISWGYVIDYEKKTIRVENEMGFSREIPATEEDLQKDAIELYEELVIETSREIERIKSQNAKDRGGR